MTRNDVRMQASDATTLPYVVPAPWISGVIALTRRPVRHHVARVSEYIVFDRYELHFAGMTRHELEFAQRRYGRLRSAAWRMFVVWWIRNRLVLVVATAAGAAVFFGPAVAVMVLLGDLVPSWLVELLTGGLCLGPVLWITKAKPPTLERWGAVVRRWREEEDAARDYAGSHGRMLAQIRGHLKHPVSAL